MEHTKVSVVKTISNLFLIQKSKTKSKFISFIDTVKQPSICCGSSITGPEGPGLNVVLVSYFLICSPV